MAAIFLSFTISAQAGPAKYDPKTRSFRITYTFAALPSWGMTPDQIEGLGELQSATPAQDAKIRALHQAVSQVLEDITDKRARISSLDYVGSIKKADVVISLTGNFQRAGWSTQGTTDGSPGQVGLYYLYMETQPDQDNVYTLAHELSHYLFGLPDEYNSSNTAMCPPQGGGSLNPGCLMDNYFIRHGYRKICQNADHNPQGPALNSGTILQGTSAQDSCQLRIDNFFKEHPPKPDFDADGDGLPDPPAGLTEIPVSPEEPFTGKFRQLVNSATMAVRDQVQVAKSKKRTTPTPSLEFLRILAKKYLDAQLKELQNDSKFIQPTKDQVARAYDVVANRVLIDKQPTPELLTKNRDVLSTLRDKAKELAGSQQKPASLLQILGVGVPSEKELKPVITKVVNGLTDFMLSRGTKSLLGFAPTDSQSKIIDPETKRYIEQIAREAVIGPRGNSEFSTFIEAANLHIRLSLNTAATINAIASELDLPGPEARRLNLEDLEARLSKFSLPGKPFTGFGTRRTYVVAPHPLEPKNDRVRLDAGDNFFYHDIRNLMANQFMRLIQRERTEFVNDPLTPDPITIVRLDALGYSALSAPTIQTARMNGLTNEQLSKSLQPNERFAKQVSLFTKLIEEIRRDRVENIIILAPPGGLSQELGDVLEEFRAQVIDHPYVRVDVVLFQQGTIPLRLRDLVAQSGGTVQSAIDLDELGAVAQRLKNEVAAGSWVSTPQKGFIDFTVRDNPDDMRTAIARQELAVTDFTNLRKKYFGTQEEELTKNVAMTDITKWKMESPVLDRTIADIDKFVWQLRVLAPEGAEISLRPKATQSVASTISNLNQLKLTIKELGERLEQIVDTAPSPTTQKQISELQDMIYQEKRSLRDAFDSPVLYGSPLTTTDDYIDWSLRKLLVQRAVAMEKKLTDLEKYQQTSKSEHESILDTSVADLNISTIKIKLINLVNGNKGVLVNGNKGVSPGLSSVISNSLRGSLNPDEQLLSRYYIGGSRIFNDNEEDEYKAYNNLYQLVSKNKDYLTLDLEVAEADTRQKVLEISRKSMIYVVLCNFDLQILLFDEYGNRQFLLDSQFTPQLSTKDIYVVAKSIIEKSQGGVAKNSPDYRRFMKSFIKMFGYSMYGSPLSDEMKKTMEKYVREVKEVVKQVGDFDLELELPEIIQPPIWEKEWKRQVKAILNRPAFSRLSAYVMTITQTYRRASIKDQVLADSSRFLSEAGEQYSKTEIEAFNYLSSDKGLPDSRFLQTLQDQRYKLQEFVDRIDSLQRKESLTNPDAASLLLRASRVAQKSVIDDESNPLVFSHTNMLRLLLVTRILERASQQEQNLDPIDFSEQVDNLIRLVAKLRSKATQLKQQGEIDLSERRSRGRRVTEDYDTSATSFYKVIQPTIRISELDAADALFNLLRSRKENVLRGAQTRGAIRKTFSSGSSLEDPEVRLKIENSLTPAQELLQDLGVLVEKQTISGKTRYLKGKDILFKLTNQNSIDAQVLMPEVMRYSTEPATNNHQQEPTDKPKQELAFLETTLENIVLLDYPSLILDTLGRLRLFEDDIQAVSRTFEAKVVALPTYQRLTLTPSYPASDLSQSREGNLLSISFQQFTAEDGAEMEFILGLSRPLRKFDQLREAPPKLQLFDGVNGDRLVERPYLRFDPEVSTETMLVYRAPKPNLKAGLIGKGTYTPKLLIDRKHMPILNRENTINFTFSVGTPRPNVQLIAGLRQPQPKDGERQFGKDKKEDAFRGTILPNASEAIIEIQVLAGAPVMNAKVTGVFQWVDNGSKNIDSPNVEFLDDGVFPDSKKDDGIYTGTITLQPASMRTPAEYRIYVQAKSTDKVKFIPLAESILGSNADEKKEDPNPPPVPDFQRASSINFRASVEN